MIEIALQSSYNFQVVVLALKLLLFILLSGNVYINKMSKGNSTVEKEEKGKPQKSVLHSRELH